MSGLVLSDIRKFTEVLLVNASHKMSYGSFSLAATLLIGPDEQEVARILNNILRHTHGRE